ncbi:MAG: aldehyde dehydrogenase family protein [Acidimicrobiia bacterium]|nr:MAG: aldehyde dehydrogenase family protein [Acidimicrobiia bacterium]
MRVSEQPELEASLKTLSLSATGWRRTSTEDKARLLRTVARRFFEVSDDLVAASLAARGVGPDRAGEDWVSGPVAVLRTWRLLAGSLEAIARTGRVAIPDGAFGTRPDGTVTVDVIPADRWDRVLYRGWKAEVWMEPGIGIDEARHHTGGAHTKPNMSPPGVAAVLGAGNVISIAPLDLAHQLFVEGRVAILKFSPVNDHIGPFVEHAFAPLVAAGFVRFAYGGPDVGEFLVHHPLVDAVHVTGSERTHDAIVFGSGEDGKRRKAEGRPLLRKQITSELGNVSPVIVVPGRWSDRDVARQARHVATQVVHNSGFNCNAAKVVVVPASWNRRQQFVDALAEAMSRRSVGSARFPGTAERYRRALTAVPRVRQMGAIDGDSVPPTLLEGLDEVSDAPVFSEEAFCQLAAVVDIDGSEPGGYLERAVGFVNQRLRGTLNVTLLVDPETARLPETRLARAVEHLEYGSVGVNVWAAAAYPLGTTPWGARPGHTLDDVQSGIGFVHNACLIDRPIKTVVSAPFRMVPEPPWSVFHRRSAATMRRLAAFEADPGPLRLAATLGAAIRP